MAVLFAAGITLYSLKSLPYPFVWSGLAWLVALLCLAVALSGNARKALTAMCAALFALVIAESCAAVWNAACFARLKVDTAVPKYTVPDQVLGYAPAPSQTAHAVRKSKVASPLYDAVYTINEVSLRATPDSPSNVEEAAVFFGGSFMFGEGLDDTETIANQVSLRYGGKQGTLACHNFGYHGYGPHQMLAALREGLVKDRVPQSVRHVIYEFIPCHVHRTLGYASWSLGSKDSSLPGDPRYVVNADGHVIKDGHFMQVPVDNALASVTNQIHKSSLFELVPQSLWRKYNVVFTPDEIEACGAVIEAARDYCTEHFPDSDFHALLWDDGMSIPHDIATQLRECLATKGVSSILITEVVPEIGDAPAGKYQIRSDSHPAALTNSMVADFLQQRWSQD